LLRAPTCAVFPGNQRRDRNVLWVSAVIGRGIRRRRFVGVAELRSTALVGHVAEEQPAVVPQRCRAVHVERLEVLLVLTAAHVWRRVLNRAGLAALLHGTVDEAAKLALAAVRRCVARPKADAQRGRRLRVGIEGPGAADKGADEVGPALRGGARLTTDGAHSLAADQVDQSCTDHDENQPTSHDALTKPHRRGP
jgi:hypothetical protein